MAAWRGLSRMGIDCRRMPNRLSTREIWFCRILTDRPSVLGGFASPPWADASTARHPRTGLRFSGCGCTKSSGSSCPRGEMSQRPVQAASRRSASDAERLPRLANQSFTPATWAGRRGPLSCARTKVSYSLTGSVGRSVSLPARRFLNLTNSVSNFSSVAACHSVSSTSTSTSLPSISASVWA